MDKEINSSDRKSQHDKWIVTVVSNDNLICRDCIYRNDEKAGICKMYQNGKPDSVFEKGECSRHVKVQVSDMQSDS